MNRRGFRSALIAPIGVKAIPPAVPKPVDLGDLPRPTHYSQVYHRNFTLDSLKWAYMDCCWGKHYPQALYVSPNGWNLFLNSMRWEDRNWVMTDGYLHKRGYRTLLFNGSEVVLDKTIKGDEVWLVNRDRLEDAKYNARVYFFKEAPDAPH